MVLEESGENLLIGGRNESRLVQWDGKKVWLGKTWVAGLGRILPAVVTLMRLMHRLAISRRTSGSKGTLDLS